MNTGKAFLGILGGVAFGAALGVLFAPEKGTNTRRKITNKKDKYKNDMSDKFNDFVDSITQKFDSMKKEVTRMTENGKVRQQDVVV